MLQKLLPPHLYSAISKTPFDKLNEIRIRLNKPIVINIAGKSYYLSLDGLSSKLEKAIIASNDMIDNIIKNACESSVYAYSEQIKQGFITIKGGIRIGISGEGVLEKNSVKTLKNISSLSIRYPKEVKGCAKAILPYLIDTDFQNTLIVSPPGCGKTTLIRDIIYQLSQRSYCYNVLLIDERYEIASSFNGIPTLDVGNFCDVLSGVNKGYGFEVGIKNMRPDIVVTDEIGSSRDCEAINKASTCGIKILASIHATNVQDLEKKPDFGELIINKVFKRYVVLSSNNGPGTLVGVYDENFRCISY